MKRFVLPVLAFITAFCFSMGAFALETAEFDYGYFAPRCKTGQAPCQVPQALINGRGEMTDGVEPNEPNTISTSPCADGDGGYYHGPYESIDSFNVYDLSGDTFMPGDTLRLRANVWCYNSSDYLNVFMSDSLDSPSWTRMGYAGCTGAGAAVLSVDFNLGPDSGVKVIRASFTYNNTTSSCLSGTYNDRDDVIINVNDYDLDGLPDDYELASGCLMAYTADELRDPDSDGLSSQNEYLAGTSPCDPDTDSDGMPDGWELLNGLGDELINSDRYDSDSDGLYDLGEYLQSCNPDGTDSDGGGVLDGAEAQNGRKCSSNLDDFASVLNSIGGTSSNWASADRMRGNFYEVDTATVMSEFQMYLNPPSGTTLAAVIYEGDSPGGTMNLIWKRDRSAGTGGAGWYSSSETSVILLPGRTYFIGMSWSSSYSVTYYAYLNAAAPVDFHFGQVRYNGFINGSAYPPPASYAIGTGTTYWYYQRIRTCTEGCFPKNVLLMRDAESYSDANTSLLDEFGISYDIANRTGIGSVNLFDYDKVVIESSQPLMFYDEIENQSDKIEEWLEMGGDMSAHYSHEPSMSFSGVYPPGIEISTYNDNDLDVIEEDHWAVVGVDNAGIENWSYSSTGEFSDMAGTVTNVINNNGDNEPVLYHSKYYQGDAVATTITVEKGADPDNPLGAGEYLHRNLLLNEYKPTTTCGGATVATIFDTTSSGSATNTYRGEKYLASEPSLLIEFQQKIDPQDGGSIHFIVMEASTLNGTYTIVWERLKYAGDSAPAGYYSSGPINFRLKPGKYYALLAGWRASTANYWRSASGLWPVATEFGQAVYGAHYSTSYPMPESATISSNLNAFSQKVVSQPYDRCILPDRDGDGLSDSYENLFSTSSYFYADTDGDGMNDYFELAYGFNPASNDASGDPDGDGIANQKEAVYGTDPYSYDTDGDGMKDDYEVYNNLDPAADDSAADGDGDGLDNYSEYSSGTDPQMADTDGDGMEDGWEIDEGLDPLDPSDGALDGDGDGMNNWMEFFYGTLMGASDSDGDGLSDYDEVFLYLTDPNNADTDGDGVPDGWEIEYGTDPFFFDSYSDADEDGITSLVEYWNMTDPLYPNNDNDRDALPNESEDNTGVFVDIAHTGSSPIISDTDNGGELDGLEAYLGTEPNSTPGDDRKWTTPARAYPSSYEDENPTIGVSGADSVTLAFEYTGAATAIKYRRWQGSSWSGYSSLAYSTANSHDPKLRRSKDLQDDTLFLFWQDSNSSGPSYSLMQALFVGTTFQYGETLFTTTAQAFMAYDVAIDSKGVRHAVWTETYGGDYYVRYKQFCATCTADQILEGPVSQAAHKVSIAVDKNDLPHVVWTTAGTATDIKYRYIKYGISFVSAAALGQGIDPSIEVDRNGNVYAAWNQGNEIQVRKKDNTGWYLPENVSNTVSNSVYPELESDLYGNLALFWNEQANDQNVIHMTMNYKGQWLKPVKVGTGQVTSTSPRRFSMAGKSNGDLFVLYREIYTDGTDTENTCSRLEYPDSDSDQLNDRLEFFIGSDYLDPDTDDDGLSDGVELKDELTNPLFEDTDGDGVNDGTEIALGIDPNEPDSDEGEEQDGLELFVERDPDSAGDDLEWSANQNVFSGSWFIGQGRMAVAGDGAIYAVYPEYMWNPTVHFKEKQPGGSWTSSVEVPVVSGDYFTNPRVEAGPGETVSVIYEVWIGTQKDVYVRTRDSSGWNSEINLSNCAPSVCKDPNSVVGPDGTLHLVYEKRAADYGVGDVIYRFNDGSGWSAETNLSNAPTSHSEGPRIDVGPDGILHAVWSDDSYGNYEVAYAKKDGSSWSSPVRLTETYATSGGPTVRGAYDGQAFVAYEEYAIGSSYYSQIYFTYGKDEQWSLPERPFGDENANLNAAGINSIAFGGNNFFLATSLSSHVEGYFEDLFILPYNQGKWYAPFNLYTASPGSAISVTNVDVKLDSEGNAHVLYTIMNEMSETTTIVYKRSQYQDYDGDGISNFQEFYLGTDPFLADTDGDLLTDYEELQYLTDPTLFDTDGDGLSDREEALYETTDPTLYDTDGDLVPDTWEILMGTNELVADGSNDPDGDGLTNFQEFLNHTDPFEYDTDGDYMPDGWEVANGLIPILYDSWADDDADGLANLIEYVEGTDPQDPDSDGDGMPDGWEFLYDTDPLVNDALADYDGDGLVNGNEYGASTDPHDPDTDDDLMDDAWEVLKGLDPLADDSALDPDTDGLDNLGEYGNNTDPHDSDTDDDGMPDGWEVDNRLNPRRNDAADDPDSDNLNNLAEYNGGVNSTDPNDSDSDDDGLRDDLESIEGTDPNDPDSDGDGMPDGYESENACLLPASGDSTVDFEPDELTNLQEYGLGTDPCDLDSDGDGMPDGWEFTYNLDPLEGDSAEDADLDGIKNIDEYLQGKNPRDCDDVPTSHAWITSAITNQNSVLIGYTCTDAYAEVKLYKSREGESFIYTGLVLSGETGSFNYSFPVDEDGEYRFYSIATLSAQLTETAPATYDDSIFVDRVNPQMLSVVDEGDYTSNDSTLSVVAGATDQGQAGVIYYHFSIGTDVYPNSGWNSVTSWIIDYDGVISYSASYSSGTEYFFSVRAVDHAGNIGQPQPSDGIVVDSTGPSSPVVVDDGTYTGYTDRFHATWSGASDAESGIFRYDYAIGSSAGATDVVGWTDNATLTEVTRFGLELEDGSSYFIGVRAVNGAGLTSVGWSDGILVDSRGPEIAWSSPAHREIVNDDMPPVDLPVSINFMDPGGAGIDWASLEMVLDFSTVQSFSQDGDTVSFDALALDLGNHVVNVQVADLAGNGLNRNVIFVVEDPRRVIINPVYVEWAPGDGDATFVADGGTGAYRWAATGGALDSFTGAEVVFTPGPEAGAYVVAVSDAKLVSAQATIIISGEVEVAPAVVRLSAGSAATFTASGGSGDFSWTVNGGSCVLSADRDETCSYTAFESSGQYSVKAQAGSGESFTSRVIVTDPVGRAIVVVGGGLVDSNRQVEALNSLGHLAYETLLARGFEPDQIMYLNPDATQAYDGDGDGYADDVDGAPTPAALQAAILDWATADLGVDNPGVGPGVPLIIYMVDHGGDDSFLINFTAAGAGQEVTPTQLDSWIDAVQGGDTSNPNGVDVVVIYDACRSGSFLDEVGGGGSDRIVITSSASSESAYFGVSGTISFSQFFWQRVRTGATLKSAFNDAAAALATWATQTPWLDDNGSGTYAATGDGKDGDAADLFVVGADFVTGAVLPELTPRGDALLEGDSLDIYSGILYASSSEISAMFAILTPPGFSPPQSEGNFDTPWLEDEEGNPLPRVYLEYSSATDDWRRRLDSAELAELFTVNGRYTATLYAIDLEGRVTAAAEFSITVFGPDPYEDDDWWSSGSSVEVNSSSAQAHNFHDSGDRDWVKFSVAFGDTGYYSVYTENLADRCDTVIELYGYSVAGSTVVPIAFDDDSGQDGGGSSRIFMYLSEGLYYAEVYQYGDTIGGQDTEYDLRVGHDEGDYGSVEGYVTDSVTGFGVQGANVIVILGGPPRVATTGAGGYYKLSSLLAGSGYPMQVQAANFTTWSGTVNVGVNQTTRKDVVLAAKTGTSGVLMGHVYGHGGAPLVGVGLEVSGKSVVSEAGGLYSIRLAPGAAYVYSSWPGYEPYLEEGLMVVAGDTTVHEVSLEPVDTDGDGLPDWIETSGCTDESEADSDGDGLCDGDTAVYDGATLVCSAGEDLDLDGEVGASETDPCDDDSDGDLLGDGDEALTYGTDPLEVDTDSDGLGDRLEAVVVSCLDPTDDDTDDDGLLDGTSQGEDKDGDGVVDATETSPCLFDTDTDTLGDGAEVTVYGTDPLEVDTDSDGLSDGLEVPWCTSPTDEDSDGDGLLDGTPSGEDKDGDGVVDATETNPCAFDSDSDGIGDGLELGTYGTNPLRQDTDSDGIGDYVEAVSSACLDATEADTDGDGLLDGTIFGEDKDGDGVVDPGETNPCLEDSDEDGLGDDEEPGLGLDPLEWDTDGDALPDGYEVANSSGHALNLDPLDPGDGCASDFDGDGNANCHEYYNGTDIWSENVTGGSACFSWADSGSTVSADGLVSPLDLGALNARASLKDASYTGVLPPNGDSQELDMDEIISALDLAVLRQMVANLSTSGNPSRPVALEVYGDTAVTAEVGSTVRIELGALNQGGKHTSSLGIIFTIDPSSTASATLLGGDGAASSGRYDVTGPIATGGRSAIVLLPTAPGSLLLNAHLPPCGVDGKGRYCEELIKQPLVTVTVE